MKYTQYKVSLVIPTVNRNSLELTKESIANQTLPPDELIIIEDVNRRGPSWSRNQGIERATGDLIAFTDDDCLLENDWLEKLVNACIKFDADIVGGTMIETDPFLYERRIRNKYPTKAVRDDGTYTFDTCSILYRKTILNKCKKAYGYFFNEEMPKLQDVEMSWRLRMLGGKFVFVPANPTHLRKVGFWSYQKLQFGRGKGIAYLHKTTQRKEMPLKPLQKSMLWGKSTEKGMAKWTGIIFKNVFGPFDRKNFSSTKHFFYYWTGEKARALGYLMERFF